MAGKVLCCTLPASPDVFSYGTEEMNELHSIRARAILPRKVIYLDTLYFNCLMEVNHINLVQAVL